MQYKLIGAGFANCKVNSVDPQEWLEDVLLPHQWTLHAPAGRVAARALEASEEHCKTSRLKKVGKKQDY